MLFKQSLEKMGMLLSFEIFSSLQYIVHIFADITLGKDSQLLI